MPLMQGNALGNLLAGDNINAISVPPTFNSLFLQGNSISGSKNFRDSVHNYQPIAASSVAHSNDGTISFNGSDGYLQYTGPGLEDVRSWERIICFSCPNPVRATPQIIWTNYNGSSAGAVVLSIEATGYLSLYSSTFTASGQIISSLNAISANRYYVVRVVYTHGVNDASSLTELYLNGVLQASTTGRLLFNARGTYLAGSPGDPFIGSQWGQINLAWYGENSANPITNHLLLNFTGSDGSQAFVDSSPRNATVTRHGNVDIQGNRGRFFGDGSNDGALSIPSSPALTNRPFKISLGIEPISLVSPWGLIVGTYNAATGQANSLISALLASGQISLSNGGSSFVNSTAALTVGVSARIDILYSPNSGNAVMAIWINDIYQGLVTGVPITSMGTVIWIGQSVGDNFIGQRKLSAYLDNLRIDI